MFAARWLAEGRTGRAGMAVLQGGIYDDGRPDVPGGVTGPVDRVVVVGAGIAGLTVANARVTPEHGVSSRRAGPWAVGNVFTRGG